jgi:hypothetical protein
LVETHFATHVAAKVGFERLHDGRSPLKGRGNTWFFQRAIQRAISRVAQRSIHARALLFIQ